MDIKIETKTTEYNLNFNFKVKPPTLARFNIQFETEFGRLTFKNFQIFESPLLNERLNDYINIVPPSIRFRFGYHPVLFFNEDTKWFEFEKLVYKHYREEKSTRPTFPHSSRTKMLNELKDLQDSNPP